MGSDSAQRSPSHGFFSKAASIADISKAYKSFRTKWNPHKNSSNESDKAESDSNSSHSSVKYASAPASLNALSGKKRDHDNPELVPKTPSTNNKKNNTWEDEDDLVISKPVLLSRIGSRRDIYNGSFSRCHSSNGNPNSTPTTPNRMSTPLIYSQTTARRKPPPEERILECTLEELLHGCIKVVPITRDVVTDVGLILQEEETLRIRVKSGWRKGTKITFQGKGDEKPGTLPADLIFVIEEKRHPIFNRIGDHDLELGVEIPLVQSLTGCSNINVPLLDGETMSVSVDDDIILYPGYEKIIPGQGMPNSSEEGKGRGNLRLKFLVEFPSEMSDEQRSQVFGILNDCCY